MEGELEQQLAELMAPPVRSLYLVHSLVGVDDPKKKAAHAITAGSLRTRFEHARTAAGVDFQFRDLRAKGGSDADDLETAQRLLGHAAATTTDRYIRRRVGCVVHPINRKIG